MVINIGPGRHIVHYPLDGHDTINYVAVFHPTKAAAAPTGANGQGAGQSGAALLDVVFAGDHPDVRAAVPYLDRGRSWPVRDHDFVHSWVTGTRATVDGGRAAAGRLVLVGDAAHPVQQYAAQGACLALEDADSLAGHAAGRVPTRPTPGTSGTPGGPLRGKDWDITLAFYVAERVIRTSEAHRRIRDWGELLHADGIGRELRNSMLRDRSPGDYRHLDWFWNSPRLSPTIIP